MAGNKPIRFRAPPEVHAAHASLSARGVDVGEMLSRHLVEQAEADTEIMRWAQAAGLRPRRYDPMDQDGVLVLVPTNGRGGPPDHRRVICSFFRMNYSGAWYANAVPILNGDEVIARSGPSIPAKLPVSQWIGYAESLLRSSLQEVAP